MEKKANVPVTILVVGVFVVCTLAIISFVLAKSNTGEDFIGVKLVELVNSQFEDFLVHKDLSRVDTKKLDDGTRVLYLEQTKTTGFLFWQKERVVFSVEYPLG